MTDSGRRRGRPPLDPHSPSTGVHVRLSTRDYDRVEALAKAQRESIQDMIRRELKRLTADLNPKT